MKPYRAIPIGGRDFVYGWYGEDKDGKCWIYHTITTFDTSHLDKFTKVIPETIAQQVGIKDKNGKEIYGEGDIYKDAEGIISVVKMAVDGWALFPIKKGPVRNLYWQNICVKTHGEIIGNTHQNPELIE